MLKQLSNNKKCSFCYFLLWSLMFFAMGMALSCSDKKVKNSAINISRIEIDTAKIDTLTLQQVVTAFGKPTGDTVFTLATPLPEFRISIYNRISKTGRYSPFIKIRELSFTQSNNRHLYIWYRYEKESWVF